MEIRLKNVRDLRQTAQASPLSFAEADLIRGDIEIVFSCDGRTETFKQSDVNVPLILSEAKKFLRDIRRQNRVIWTFYFSPFINARREFGKVVLFTGEPGDEEGGTIEVLDQKQLDSVEQILTRFQRKYGILK